MTASAAAPWTVEGARRPLRIAVSGGSAGAERELAGAEEVGRLLARHGAVLICGGGEGIMEAAARGAAGEGGLTVGVLPGRGVGGANRYISLPLPTGMGEGRNALVASFADALIAIAGEWGTLSEIALARKMGVPVVLLWPAFAELDLPVAVSPEEAARRALELARARRAEGSPAP